MATIEKKIVTQVCDISKRPVKKSDGVFAYQIGDKVYDEVAGETIAKIEKYIEGLGTVKTRAKKAKASGVADPSK